MVLNQYTSTVREDSKGQKTVTIPKNADIEGGDNIKFKKTREWGFKDRRKAIVEAQKEAAQKWYDNDDHAPDKIGFTIYRCLSGAGRNTCAWTELREKDIKKHIKEEHGLEEVDDDLYQTEWNIDVTSLARMLPMVIRRLDMENRDLHADEVADTIEEIVTNNHPDEMKLEELHDYAYKIRHENLSEVEKTKEALKSVGKGGKTLDEVKEKHLEEE